MLIRTVVRGMWVVVFRLLGPVEVDAPGAPMDAGHPRQLCVLAVLLVEASRVVSQDVLIDRVWGDDPPRSARRVLQSHLSRLRRLLDQVATAHQVPVALRRRPGGYVLEVAPELVDLHRFRRLVDESRGSGTGRVELLRTALELWRGEPLAGIEGEWAARTREAWARERVDAMVAWARAELAQGDPGPVLAGVAELASDNPLAESLTEVLMLALHAAGRTSEALEMYARTRAQLAEELGTDPGPDLQRLHGSLLRGELAVAGPSAHVPRQLPAVAPLFTGRVMELSELDKIHDASTVVITAIDGMAGVGKTALAVRAAHQMVDRYPDGQLFLDLHGYTEGVAPVEPGAALDWLLRSLGVPGERVPAGIDQRAGLFRSRLAELRMVIVLDNAATEAQVKPLLPGAPGCVVLVTSRRRLAGLDHTHTLSVDTLPLPDANTLLSQTAGEDRLAGQPLELVAEVVELCGRLPLAIRIAAARLRSHPSWDLAHLVARLRDQQTRLAELEAGQRSVTAALDLSYQDLVADERRTYRLLGLHPGADIEAYSAAALLDTTVPAAVRLLEHLLEAHLLLEPTPGRYRFHDLTRAHAAHTAARDEIDHSGREALDRLLDHYRHTAAMAMDTAYPFERGQRPQIPPAHTPGPALPDPGTASDWLDTELPNLLAATRYAADHDRPAHLLQLSTVLNRHLRTRGHYHDAEALYQQALATARATGNQAAEAEALVSLGHLHRTQGHLDRATDQYQPALLLARTTGHQAAEVEALNCLGNIHRLQGRHVQATDHHQQALGLAVAMGHRAVEFDALIGLGDIHRMQGRLDRATDQYHMALLLARTIDHRTGELTALVCLGSIHTLRGMFEQANDHYQQGLRLARAIGHPIGELNSLAGLGLLHRMFGRHDRAADHLGQAVLLARATGHRAAEQAALNGLSDIHRIQGRYEQAADEYRQLLDLATEAGSRNFQFEARQGLGRLHHATGDPDAALTEHTEALALATELDQPRDQARAHNGLAYAHDALHQPDQAREHWQLALDILTRLGTDQTDDGETTVAAIRANLALTPADPR